MTGDSQHNRFVWPLRVYFEDTDSGGVVYYANYLKYLERARSEWLRSAGVDQSVLAREYDLMFMVRSANVEYLRPARLDDSLEIISEIVERRRVSLSFSQIVVNPLAPERPLCRGLIRIACVSVQHLRPKAIPKDLFKENDG